MRTLLEGEGSVCVLGRVGGGYFLFNGSLPESYYRA